MRCWRAFRKSGWKGPGRTVCEVESQWQGDDSWHFPWMTQSPSHAHMFLSSSWCEGSIKTGRVQADQSIPNCMTQHKNNDVPKNRSHHFGGKVTDINVVIWWDGVAVRKPCNGLVSASVTCQPLMRLIFAIAQRSIEITSAPICPILSFKYPMLSGKLLVNFWDSCHWKGYIYPLEIWCWTGKEISVFILVRSSFTFHIGNLSLLFEMCYFVKYIAFCSVFVATFEPTEHCCGIFVVSSLFSSFQRAWVVPGMSYFKHGLQSLCHIKLEDGPWNDEQILINTILNWNFKSSFQVFLLIFALLLFLILHLLLLLSCL